MDFKQLKDVLEKYELDHVLKLIRDNKWSELKEFLNVPFRKDALEKKGLVADYLYYQLEAMFKQ